MLLCIWISTKNNRRYLVKEPYKLLIQKRLLFLVKMINAKNYSGYY